MNLVSFILLLILRMFVAVVKTTFNSMTRVDLRQLADRYVSVARLVENRIRFQFTLFIVDEITIVALFMSWLLLGIPGLPEGWLPLVGIALLYLAAEKLLVSVLAFVSREWILSRFLLAYRPLYYLAILPILAADLIAARLLHMEDSREDGEAEREQEERAFIDVATEDGIIEEDEKELIKGVLEFGETVVREIMTPRTDIDAVDVSTGYDDLVNMFRDAKHSRIPVYQETVDDIIGILHLKDLIQTSPDGFRLRDILQKPFYVPETKRVTELLREMQVARTKMAVILDEYGGTAGLVTIEDLMEEIVGEIEDEHDTQYEEVQELNDGVYRVDGRCNVETLEQKTGIILDMEDIDTVGGAVFSVFGRIPSEGEQVSYESLDILVEEMDRRRVVSVILEEKPDKAISDTDQEGDES